VLADGLTYARQLGATHLIDAATLTGACVVALGHDQRRRLLQRRRDLREVHAALATSGEKFWRLPLGEEYAEHDQERHRRHQEHRRTLAAPSPPRSS
jgi:leucyl aminopeptidase